MYAVNAEFAALKDRNEQQRRRVDDVLTKRLQLEKRAKEVSAINMTGCDGDAAMVHHKDRVSCSSDREWDLTVL